MGFACSTTAERGQEKVSGTNAPEAAFREQADDGQPPELPGFFLIVDTGYRYYALRDTMIAIARRSHWLIDTLDRTYKPWRDSILPVDSTMAYFNGDYYPLTRFAESLSIEYWADCASDSERAPHNKMAIVAGAYERRTQADSALQRILRYHPAAFVCEGMLMNHEIH